MDAEEVAERTTQGGADLQHKGQVGTVPGQHHKRKHEVEVEEEDAPPLRSADEKSRRSAEPHVAGPAGAPTTTTTGDDARGEAPPLVPMVGQDEPNVVKKVRVTSPARPSAPSSSTASAGGTEVVEAEEQEQKMKEEEGRSEPEPIDMDAVMEQARLQKARRNPELPSVAVIIPIYNARRYLPECFESIVRQTYAGPIEVSLYDDGCDDGSPDVIQQWIPVFTEAGFSVKLRRNDRSKGRGCGFAKNRSIEQSSGEYLCFLDADDIMKPQRIELQLQAAQEYPDAIIGSNFSRTPKGSTERYTRWCNSLTHDQLMSHRFREVTIIQPTWFMSRKTFEKVGAYDETYPGCPEDLIFFYAHLGKGGDLRKVDKKLLVYRYHPESTCKAIHRLVLLKVRSQAIQDQVISKWDHFTIWSVGRDGKKFFNSLSVENQKKVMVFCDIDPKKLGTKHTTRQMKADNVKPIPIVHYTEAKPPIITCVALDRTDGKFERNLAELQLREGVDYLYFV